MGIVLDARKQRQNSVIPVSKNNFRVEDGIGIIKCYSYCDTFLLSVYGEESTGVKQFHFEILWVLILKLF